MFEACSLRDGNMAGSRFTGADLRGADLGGLRLVDAALFRGATISRDQAGQLLGELGLNVR
ncbi:Pentapeptide repeat-containing protein [Sphingomonas sp. NFR15]|nr:Pentapeptide repeat-containing protein [Sphingomonas sp. NFR15]